MERSDPVILGLIGCKKNPKYAPKEPFPQAVKDLCQSPEELIETAKIVKHPEKFANICANSNKKCVELVKHCSLSQIHTLMR